MGCTLQVQACAVADVAISDCQHNPSSASQGASLLSVPDERSNLPLDQFLTGAHLLKQRRIPNDPRRILDLPARLIQPRNNPHDGPFHDIGQIGDAVE